MALNNCSPQAGTDAPSDAASSPLARAEQAAQGLSDSLVVDATTMPCEQAAPEKKCVDVIVVGDDGTGLAGISLLLTRGDGQVLVGKTGPADAYRFKGLEPGSYALSLPDLDKDAWIVKSTEDLPDAEAGCASIANWQLAATLSDTTEQTHIIQQGECIGKIAEQYGFFPESIWRFLANKDLANRRHDIMYILSKGDVVVIPAKQQKAVTVTSGHRVTVQRLGVPEYLRIRFLGHDDAPRAGVSYLLTLVINGGDPLGDMSGNTDSDGFVYRAIPPSTVGATIILNPGPLGEVHQFNLGFIDPIDEVSGWQARLNNLGYDCGPEDNRLGPKTEAAICAFQRANNLEATGVRDEASRAALLALALS